MSIADKLITIAENTPKVYEAGKAEGYIEGQATLNETVAGLNETVAGLIERTLTELEIPFGVKRIGDSAFFNHYALKSLVIPEGVEILQRNCLAWTAITELELPMSCHTLEDLSLSGMWAAEKIKFGNVKSIGSRAFAQQNACIEYDFTRCDSVPTLANVDAFDDYALKNNPKIIVPDILYDEWINATNWAEYADYITIEHSEGLEYYYDSEKEGYCLIGRGSFDGSIIVVPPVHNDGVNGSHPVVSVGVATGYGYYDILRGDDKLELVKLPESVTDVIPYSFSECVNLKKLYMPGIRYIGSFEYKGLPSLEYVKFGKNLTNISGGSFSDSENAVYDFSEAEAVPSFDSYGYGSEFGIDPTIKVPAALLEEWKNATNWSLYADHIVDFGAKSAPKEENFDIFVGASLLQEIVNYNFSGIKLATGVGKNELLSECGVPYLRIYGDGSSPEAFAQIKNIEGKTTGKYLVFAYRRPTSSAENYAYFEIYSNTTNGSFSGEGDRFTLSAQKDGRWHVVAVDIAEAISTSPSVIGGSESQFIANSDGSYTIQKLRIDWFNQETSTDSYVDIAYVGVCDTLEDARNADDDYEDAEFDAQRIKNRCDAFSINARIQRLENGMEYVKIIQTTTSGIYGSEAYVELYTSSTITPNVGEYAAVLFRGPENTETSAKKGGVEIWLDSANGGLDGSETRAYIGYGDLTTGERGNDGWYWGVADLTSSPYSDSVCRMIRLDYLNSVNPATEYEIDIAFLKFFGSEDEAREYCKDYMKKYDLI